MLAKLHVLFLSSSLSRLPRSAILPLLGRQIYTVSQKTVQRCFLSELRQISTNFDNFWQKDGKEAEIMRGALIFDLT